MKRITKKQVTNAYNHYLGERLRCGNINNYAVVRAEIAWRDLQKQYEEQQKGKD